MGNIVTAMYPYTMGHIAIQTLHVHTGDRANAKCHANIQAGL